MSKGMASRGGPEPGAPAPSDAAVGQANLPAVVTPEPGTIKSERPGPPKPQTETFLAKAQPDAIDTNDRQWSKKKSALREQALTLGAELKPNTNAPLFGSRVDAEVPAAEGEATEGEPATEGEATPEEAAKTAELQDIAKRDRENRRLRKELKRIEQSSATERQKETKIRELAKTNPRGVAAYFGITDEAILKEIRDKGDTPAEVPKFEEPDEPKTNAELEAERKENRQLKYQIAVRDTTSAVQEKVATDGASRWPAVAALGSQAVNEAVAQAMEFMKGAKRAPTNKEAHEILEYWLDQTNTKYAGIAKKISGAQPKGKAPPTPRNPQPGPRANPMEKREFKDPSDPRNRPTWREIGDQHRRKLFGGGS